ncbi:MAG TPA: ribosomal protein S18-alanine N-acetyltransferase [Terriglobales bacterium]
MNDALIIRPATPADVPAILALERASETAAHWGQAEYAHVFDAGAAPRVLLVAEELTIAGFIVVRTLGPEWEIENVAVLPGARGHGIGSQLVAAVLTQAGHRHAESIGLEVRASNAAARALYLHCGFAETGQRRGYYANPAEDAVLYRFDLRSRLPSAP